MLQKRQIAKLEKLADRRSQIIPLGRDYPAGHEIAPHFHDVDQLVYATRGVMTISTRDGMWVVPTQRAVWIPARTPHGIRMSGAVAIRTLYLKPRLAKALPRECCVVSVTPLLRELILQACAAGPLKMRVRRQRHLIDIILDEMEAIQTIPLQLPNPSDERAMRIVKLLAEDPGDRRPVERICKAAGLSKRTLERLFQQEVGMTFGRWRQQLRLMHALRLLAEGAKVTYAALESGYSTPSAFIAMFRKALGTTPKEYFCGGKDV